MWHLLSARSRGKGLGEGFSLLDHDNLEAFSDPEHYDDRENDAGVAFYESLARETGGPVLELACGTGRVCIPIARLGFAVTGLDIVPGMLAQARRRSAGLPVRWVEGDARSFDLGERFRLVFLTGNAFQLFLTNADQQALLERVRAHLHDHGLLAFETRNPIWGTPRTHVAMEAVLQDARERGDYDHVTQILHVRTTRRRQDGGEERASVSRIALRYTFPRELAALLHSGGFTIDRQYGGWGGEPLTAASTSIIVVCRRQA
jgi:SAM-dependent methyltransferase